MLVLYDPSKELFLCVNSSSFGVEAVLSKKTNNRKNPIALYQKYMQKYWVRA